jgi:hypothetical protein
MDALAFPILPALGDAGLQVDDTYIGRDPLELRQGVSPDIREL